MASVSVTRADGTLTASWNAPANATRYHVTYTDDNTQSWQLAALNHTTTGIAINVDNAKTYIVGVRAGNDADDWSTWTNSQASGPYTPPTPTPAPTPPARPTGLAATGGDGSVTLSWDDPADSSITGYEYQANHNDTSTGKFTGWGAWQSIADSGPSTTSHAFTGLANDKEQRFKLRAVNAHGAGAIAPNAAPWYVAATPGAPSIDVTDVTSTTATLTLNNHAGDWYYQASGANGNGGGFRIGQRRFRRRRRVRQRR